WQVQKESITSLGRLAASAAVPELIDFTRNSLADLRRAAAYALGELKTARATPALRALASDPDVEVRKAAAHALDAITQASPATDQEN
ncbi:MAG TPA: HEAT repeat domain-containing protein, partial [Polyangiaceae bacterium]|nr:HEAT repeat domain-containing protein [Polyangiaceae bacterium]